MEENRIYQIALSLLPKVGPILARALVGYCGGPEAVFRASKKELLRIPGIGPRIAGQIGRTGQLLERAEEEYRLLERHGIRMHFYLDEDYPARLRAFEDSPVILYAKGELELNPHRSVAIVGTRQPSPYGRQQCERIVEGLLRYQPLIVSGLAYGIDSTAHRAACGLGLPTAGVMASGMGYIYPPAHTRLAERMQEGGGLLCEHPYHTLPEKDHFPMRNRIIAAMADAVLIVESGTTGGSLITAEFANRYHRDVFALPGRVTDPKSSGCLMLIKHHKAALVEHAEDLARAMRWDEEPPAVVQRQLFPELNSSEKKIVDLLTREAQLSIDRLSAAAQMSNSELASTLLELECKGLIRALPGKRYALT